MIKKIISLLLVIMMFVTGCTSNTPTNVETDAPKGSTEDKTTSDLPSNVAKEQIIKTAYSGEITTINYLTTVSTDEFALAANLVDTLVDYDKYGVLKPCLATEWEKSDDGLTWTFHLREGVKWVTVEGEEYATLKAQDFIDALKYVLNKENGSGSANIAYSVIKNAKEYFDGDITDFDQVGVKAINDLTLEYTLKEPTPYFLSMLTYMCFFPANGQFLEEQGESFGTTNDALLYNGAYILKVYEPQDKKIQVKNENYWDKENVHITEISSKYNKEANVLSPEMFLRGDLTSISVPASLIDEWMKDPVKKDQVRPGTTGFYTYFYAFNFDPQFADEYEPENWKVAVNNTSFRKAVFHGMDRIAAMTTSEPYDPNRRLNNTIVPKNFASISGVDYVKIGGLAKYTDGESFNKDLATQFRDKAKKELEGKATFPIKMMMPYNTGVSSWGDRCQVIEQQLENLLGSDFIDVIPVSYPSGSFLNSTRRCGNYAFQEVNNEATYLDPQTYTVMFTPTSNFNFPHNITEVDENGKNIYTVYQEKIELAKKEINDIQKRYELFADAETYFLDKAIAIPYGVSGGGFMASKLNPFESPYSPFGVSAERYKGMYVMEKAMNTDEFYEAQKVWEKERSEALKAANQ